ncbi:MAG: hypothetical protein JXA89_14490 [Anaerolineae bacterium]|nr:hypothetical protein [Anaerolineae bacterium]
MDEHKIVTTVVSMLAHWAQAVEKFWTDWGDGSGLGCYGPGYIHWGVQSNFNYAAAMAALAAQPGVERAETWRDRALTALRFALSTHLTGDRPGLNGEQWGRSWISMLGIERAMHGLPLMEPYLAGEDRTALRRVLVSEADWLLHHGHRGNQHGVIAGMWNSDGRNAPESNIWSGALLWRTAQMYPNEPAAGAWMERAHQYFINGISIPADAQDDSLLAGKAVRERHVGANFFSSYALDHHGYLNVGYMVICISNAAMLHFDMKKASLSRPASLDHHQEDLWRVVKQLIFGDGRLARIGGDSRVRYAYCQEYLLPSLLYAADRWRDPHALHLAKQQLALIEAELQASDDGTFYGARMGHMREANPHYYTRLESDRACVLAMLLNYAPLVDDSESVNEPVEIAMSVRLDGGETQPRAAWIAPEHGAVMHRCPTRLASFSWRAHGLTQAMCQPPDVGHLAEWLHNLCPVVQFLGSDPQQPGRHRRLLRQRVGAFDGGFVCCGSVMEGIDVRIDEGAQCTDQATTHLAFAALPDGRTCLGLQFVVTAPDRIGYTTALKSLHLNVANDLFNGFRRRIYTANGTLDLVSPPERDEIIPLGSRWATVDNRIGLAALYGGNSLVISRSRERRGGRYHSLYVDELCLQAETTLVRRGRGEVLIDIGFAALSNVNAEETAAMRGGPLRFDEDGVHDAVRGVWGTDANGKPYSLVANFGQEMVTIPLLDRRIELAAGEARLVCADDFKGDYL